MFLSRGIRLTRCIWLILLNGYPNAASPHGVQSAVARDSGAAPDMSVADGVPIPPGGLARQLRSSEQELPTGLASPTLQHISSRSLASARGDSGARLPSDSAPAAAAAGGTADGGSSATGSAQLPFGGGGGPAPAAAAAASSAAPTSETERIGPMDSQVPRQLQQPDAPL